METFAQLLETELNAITFSNGAVTAHLFSKHYTPTYDF